MVELLEDVHLLEERGLVVEVQRLLGDALHREALARRLVLGDACGGVSSRGRPAARLALGGGRLAAAAEPTRRPHRGAPPDLATAGEHDW